jgi:hypothetical protein
VTEPEDFQRKLEEMAEKARRKHGFKISLEELMSAQFISRCSTHASITELFAAFPSKLDSLGGFNSIPDSEWDAFIRSQTSFKSWEEMENAAWLEWACQQNGFIMH